MRDPALGLSQTVEDDISSKRRPLITLHEQAAGECVRIEMEVRRPWSPLDFDRRLVIRASQVTGEVTAALEKCPVE